ncbi:bifunctional riboflavin kinase/FAD synthetase [[Clostridium] polysaccharolyticum]|uniref:Riboflavin biosynthesis protein n=1 Tax=[Clostridium] polysaccharolyticum TaxID=29364 RepID=A0A1I0AIJ1_9FIRM|nr:bifunctional riboflavin kinase/FAD synthetase [[Clostridium] polysaccharolyticum]SES93659.1 riboflavin kinase / FMN adenylyltransferase [[Clostridium] polysaccharolyticum]
MKYIWNTTDFHLQNTAVSLGKFDGFHIGHCLLIHYVTQLKEKGLQAVTFSFYQHPGNVVSNQANRLIYTEAEKVKKVEQLGSDYFISYPFNEEVMHTEPEEFVRTVLAEKLGARAVVVGKDYHFGKNRAGNVEMLKELGKKYGFEVNAFEKVVLDEAEVSSTRIRQELQAGNLEKANQLLGMPYSITGKVVYGNQIGRTLGMPTANVIPSKEKLVPPNGVYATRILLDGKIFYGITNIGYKPTVGDRNEKGVETFIFDFQESIYDKEITIEFFAYERGERKFGSLEELKHQMERDCQFSREYFKL